MNIPRWTDELLTGDARIDREHRELFKRILAYDAALREGRADAEGLLRFLLHYAVTHFQGEEAAMERTRFPGLQEHRAAHLELLERVREHAGKNGGANGASPDLAPFLVEWLQTHIMLKDKAFINWLHRPGSGSSDSLPVAGFVKNLYFL